MLAIGGGFRYNSFVMGRCDGMADVTDSKSVGSDTVWVRVPPPAPKRKRRPMGVFFFLVPVGNAEPVQRVSLCPDETRKETLTVSFHTILPSETFGLAVFLTV